MQTSLKRCVKHALIKLPQYQHSIQYFNWSLAFYIYNELLRRHILFAYDYWVDAYQKSQKGITLISKINNGDFLSAINILHT